jgi:hypothetical protein
LKISLATKAHIRLRQGYGGQEEHREQLFFGPYVIFCGKKPGHKKAPREAGL